MERYHLLEVVSTPSTNTYAKDSLRPDEDNTPVVVVTDDQTHGRGQRGNSWESNPGENLTFTLVVFPKWMSPQRQFELSMIVSVSIVSTLRKYVDNPEMLSVKWPNDIYFGNRKLAGILIENSIADNAILRSVIGIGLNVNQKVFVSDAPNPVSLSQILGHDIVERRQLLNDIVENILDMLDSYADDPEVDQLTALYNSMLWRNDGKPHLWRLSEDNSDFSAVLDRVDPDGRIFLTDADGNTRSFLFKEISAVF